MLGDSPFFALSALIANTDEPSRIEHSEHAMAMILLQVDDLHAAYKQAVAHGAKTIEPPQPDGVHFIVVAPDGIIIKVMQADVESQ